MNYLYFSIIGGIFAGLISTGIYELIKFYYDRWVYLTHPIKYKYMGPDKIEVYNTIKDVSAYFDLKNRTKGYLPLSIYLDICECVTYDPKPIEWIGKHINYGFQEIVLSPSEWGHFMIKGIIREPGKCVQPKCDITINIEVRIPFENNTVKITLGPLELEFKS
jgi:hypothetical protein